MSYEQKQLQNIIEGAILAAGEPLSINRLFSLFEEHDMPEKEDMLEALQTIQASCEGRGFRLIEVATGWRFQVSEDLATWVNRLWDEKPPKYSRALLETLALIAYRQPLTRGDIEEVRGVAVSSHIIKTLSERDWIKVVGHRDVPGRPSLYATTKQFLDYFNMKSLEELPLLGDIKDIESLNEALDFGELESAESENGEEKTVIEDISQGSESNSESNKKDIDSDTETDSEADADADNSLEYSDDALEESSFEEESIESAKLNDSDNSSGDDNKNDANINDTQAESETLTREG